MNMERRRQDRSGEQRRYCIVTSVSNAQIVRFFLLSIVLLSWHSWACVHGYITLLSSSYRAGTVATLGEGLELDCGHGSAERSMVKRLLSLALE